MALSKIWSAFIIIAILAGSFRYLGNANYSSIFNDLVVGKNGDTIKIEKTALLSANAKIQLQLADTNYYTANKIHYAKVDTATVQIYRVQQADGIINTCKSAVELCLGLIGIMAFFMGLMSIAEKAGGIQLLSRWIQPFFSKLFPEIPNGHPAFGHMMMNFSANLLGLDNAATPFGLKAMESLQTLNPNPEKASNAQIMFLCLHASGLTLIPVSIIATRASLKAASPTDIFLPCMIATFVATLAAMTIVSIKQKINLLQPTLLLFIAGISGIIALLVYFLLQLNKEGLDNASKLISNGLILFILLAIVLGGIYKKINIFDAFVEGATNGFTTCIKIIPYLVGMLVAVCLLRNSGVFDIIIDGFKSFASFAHLDTKWIDGIPTALIKPMSGSGARGMMIDTMKVHGVDSFAGKLSCILQGSSDTTFYVIAVYFGAVNIKNSRYAIGAMLLADLVGIITAILLCYLFFGG
jgi:spore maturation protein SpmA/spore maturation protein SpmB